MPIVYGRFRETADGYIAFPIPGAQGLFSIYKMKTASYQVVPIGYIIQLNHEHE